MIASHYGEFAALLTAFFWTITALAFEDATIRVGTFAVNIIRLTFAFVFLSILNYFMRGIAFPVDASLHAWGWLALSGIIGLLLGDLFLFASYPIISSRIAMLIMTLAPPMAAILGWFILDETMSFAAIFGMLLVIGGISLTIWSRTAGEKKFKLNYPVKGLFFAFLGAFGQALGLVLSKLGMGEYSPIAATQIRVFAGVIGFVIVITILKRWKNVFKTFSDKKALKVITLGSIFGPFLGVSFSLIAVQHTNTGIASTIMSIVPILIIPPVILIYKQKVNIKEIIGAGISVVGVALFFV